jgi:hypothetical protein
LKSLPTDIPAVIDIEASALGAGSFPIEVGLVLSCGTPFCTLIKPAQDWHRWDGSAEQAHGIPRETLYMYGRTVPEVAQALNDRLRGQTIYSDAWGNDGSWLALLFETAGCKQRFRVESLRALMSEEQACLWHPVKQRVATELALKRHRASADARILQMTFIRTREIAASQLAATTVGPLNFC